MGKNSIGIHEISVLLHPILPVQPGQNLAQKLVGVGTQSLELRDPDRDLFAFSRLGRVHSFGHLVFEGLDVVLVWTAIVAAIPVHRGEGDGTAGALREERLQPIETHRDAVGVLADAVADGWCAEEDAIAGVGRHVFSERVDGLSDVHVGLRGHVWLVEGHEIVRPISSCGGFDVVVPWSRLL